MGASGADDHHEHADRAERLAEDARQRFTAARAAAERHERSVGDPVDGEWHRRAAAIYRDAELVYGHAARFQLAHAAHERKAAENLSAARRTRDQRQSASDADVNARYTAVARRASLTDERDRAADQRARLADDRDRLADTRERGADERDAAADTRDREADERDRIADDRDRAAADRDAVATAREDQIAARETGLCLAQADDRSIADQREQIFEVHAAILRAKERIAASAQAVQRDVPPAIDESVVQHEVAESRRRQRQSTGASAARDRPLP